MSWSKTQTKYRQHLTPNIITLNDHGNGVDVFCQKNGSIRAEHFNENGNIRQIEEIPEHDLLVLLQLYHDLQIAGEESAFVFVGGRYRRNMKEYKILHSEKGAVAV